MMMKVKMIIVATRCRRILWMPICLIWIRWEARWWIWRIRIIWRRWWGMLMGLIEIWWRVRCSRVILSRQVLKNPKQASAVLSLDTFRQTSQCSEYAWSNLPLWGVSCSSKTLMLIKPTLIKSWTKRWRGRRRKWCSLSLWLGRVRAHSTQNKSRPAWL